MQKPSRKTFCEIKKEIFIVTKEAMADHDELIAQFIEISGGEENVARFYLSSSNWSLEVCMYMYIYV